MLCIWPNIMLKLWLMVERDVNILKIITGELYDNRRRFTIKFSGPMYNCRLNVIAVYL